MDQNIEALQTYNGGIIFVSYLIAVIGAMTTLELLQRRTHIRGYYNWFLLFAAACSMGGVGIWSMHFIGNNSLTITLENGDHYQLSYSAGFTFASLVVAILTMFLAFAFVGITEEARIARIIPSGVIAGFGIVSMHYLGQVAIDFFQMRNKIAFVIGASVIAVCAVTAALLIFFKLREQWANQWYKRLGCAMLMGVAVCGTNAMLIMIIIYDWLTSNYTTRPFLGMHYTALVGTMYYPGDSHTGPPTPVLATPALIGIISAIVVAGCIILFVIVAKAKIENSKLPFQKKSQKRLILDTIFFDTNGRILVKVDGVVPMKEIMTELPDNDFNEKFTSNHPLFIRLFETTMQWSKSQNKTDYQHSNTDDSNSLLQESQTTANLAAYNAINDSFINAAYELVDELRFQHLSDLGFLFDSVMNTNTILKKSMFSQESKNIQIARRTSSTASWLLTNLNPKDTQKPATQQQRRTSSYSNSTPDATVIDIFNTPSDETTVANNNLTIRDSDFEDRHIFLVKKIESNKDLVNLLSIGFRFAEPVFISKTMGEKLKVPSEYMLNYFRDMQQMTETAAIMYTPIKSSSYSMYSSSSYNRHSDLKNSEICGGVFVGLFALIEDQENSNQVPYFIVDKEKRYAFPMVQLTLENGTKPTILSRQQKNTILSLSGQSLSNISNIDSNNNNKSKQSFSENDIADNNIQNNDNFSPVSTHQSIGSVRTLIDTTSFGSSNTSYPAFGSNSSRSTMPTLDLEDSNAQFIRALETAAKSLINSSSYGKPLATSAKLYGDVLDIPAFSLRAGQCQLILFRAHITTPGTRFAINQTLTETIKCTPFPMYRSFTYHITQVALEKYRIEENKYKTPASYLTQQRLYQSTAARNKDLQEVEDVLSDDHDDNDEHEHEHEHGYEHEHEHDDVNHQHEQQNENALTAYRPAPKGEPSPIAAPPSLAFSSLPPPPRVKRNKFAFPSGIGSLDISHISKDFLPNMLKGANNIPLSPVPPSSSSEAPIVLNLLPPNARFWWLNNMYEETFNI